MSRRHFIVAIGPGHYVKASGENTGAYDAASNTSEFELNTQFAETLEDAFVDAGFITYITPRTGIRARLKAVKKRMDEYADEFGRLPVVLYFSLHQNAFYKPSANGAEVFVSYPGSKSVPLAEAALDAIVKDGRLRNRGIRYKSFIMLSGDEWRRAGVDVNLVYATLIEFGFITSKKDREVIDNPDVQKDISLCIVDNVLDWLEGTSIGLG